MKECLIFMFAIVLLFGCNSITNKESHKDVISISVRNAHSMAYHGQESSVYLFGGANEKEVLSDLWIFDHSNWRKIATNREPEPRTFAALVYDSLNNRLVLFGGSKVLFGSGPDPQNLLNDTWEFKNNQWKRINTINAPSPRAEAVMVYDKSRQKIILFGGYKVENGRYIKLGDTWELHGHNWQLVSNDGPSPRHGISLAYDRDEKSIILFGGSTVDKQYGDSSGETWKWDGEQWTRFDMEQPSGVFNASMVYDSDQKELIRFGGWNGNSRINETWSLRDNQWDKLEIDQSPSPRNHSNMVYSEKEKVTILFGGHDGKKVFGDTWKYANGQWTKVLDFESIERINNGH